MDLYKLKLDVYELLLHTLSDTVHFSHCKTLNPPPPSPYRYSSVTAFLHLCLGISACAQSTWVNLCLTTDPAFCSPLTRENNLSVDAKISVLAVGSGRHLIQPHWTKDILVY